MGNEMVKAASSSELVVDVKVIESLVLRGDLSGLNPAQRAAHYIRVCERLGLDPYTQPFEYLRLNGKEVMYAKRGATDQLAAMHRLNRRIVDGPKVIDLAGTKLVYAVAEATHPNGRVETSVATVPLIDPVNVLMKCETKAKRRVTLSILGLGMLDEGELDTIPAAVQEPGGGLVLPPRAEPSSSTQAANESDVEPEPEEGPSSRAFSAYVDELTTAATLAAVHNAYAGMIDGLNEEGADIEYWTQGDDGAGSMAYRRMSALGHRLSSAERSQVLLSRPLAEIIDTQTGIEPGPAALAKAVAWWFAHRAEVKALEEQAHRSTPYMALVRRYSASTDAPSTKKAREALDAAVKAADKGPTPDGTNGGSKGNGAAQNAPGATTETPASTSSPRALLEQYSAHLSAVPDRGADHGAARIAGGYFKRREDFFEAGVRAEALGLVVDELTRRGVAEPHTWLTEIGERNGYVTRTRKAA